MSTVVSLLPIISNFECCSSYPGILHLEGDDQIQRAESFHQLDDGKSVLQWSPQSAGWIYSLIAYETDRGISGWITKDEYDLIKSVKDIPTPLTLNHPNRSGLRCMVHGINLREFDNVADYGPKSFFVGTVTFRKI